MPHTRSSLRLQCASGCPFAGAGMATAVLPSSPPPRTLYRPCVRATSRYLSCACSAVRRACPCAAAEPGRPSEPGSAPVEVIPPQPAAAAWSPASAAAAGLAGFGGGAPGGPSRADQARQMRQTAAMLRINPGMAQHVMSAAANITPEQMQAAVRTRVSVPCHLECFYVGAPFPAVES